MILEMNGRLRFMTVAEHLQHKPVVFWDTEHLIRLSPDKNHPFSLIPHHAESIYIDLFALRFGHKEQLLRRVGKGSVAIQYSCPRAIRDEILLLPADDLIVAFAEQNCYHQDCQYWSHPTGVKSKYAINCLLARYMAMNSIDIKSGLTLEEVSRIFKCTRERIRQIEEKAMRRMRHHTRMTRFAGFQEQSLLYQTYTPVVVEDIA